MDLIEIERMIAEATVKLEAKNTQLGEELAAAQATIEQMREALEEANALNINWSSEAEPEALAYFSEYRKVTALGTKALALPTNLDALHEARALECERLAGMFPRGSMIAHRMLEEAAAHRARKQATKEEGK